MTMQSSPSTSRWLRFVWIAIAATSAVYAAFALAAAFGLVEQDKIRAAPMAFALHAAAGSVALLCGALQFSAGVRRVQPWLHRTAGRVYVLSASLASLSGMISAARFEVGFAAQASFLFAAGLWLGVTLIGWSRIRQRRLASHAAWMTRSYALALFFVTFSFWTPLFASFEATRDIAYPLGVTLSWLLNLVVAEGVIRRRNRLVADHALIAQPQ